MAKKSSDITKTGPLKWSDLQTLNALNSIVGMDIQPVTLQDINQDLREQGYPSETESLTNILGDLNYIYGYEEGGCFVPVDGQQRLTTLWLLYLYLYARSHNTKEFRVHMKFASREYAGDFCERLHEHLEELLNNKGVSLFG